MAKVIVPMRLIFSSNSDGVVTDAVLQYKVNDNGSVSGIKSVSVKAGYSEPSLDEIISGAIASANQSEGL